MGEGGDGGVGFSLPYPFCCPKLSVVNATCLDLVPTLIGVVGDFCFEVADGSVDFQGCSSTVAPRFLAMAIESSVLPVSKMSHSAKWSISARQLGRLSASFRLRTQTEMGSFSRGELMTILRLFL